MEAPFLLGRLLLAHKMNRHLKSRHLCHLSVKINARKHSIEYVYIKILCKTILFTKQMAQCDCTVNAHAHSRHVKGVSFHKILSDSSQTVTDISGKIHN